MNFSRDFDTITLDQIEEVNLMNRVDLKYYFHLENFQTILRKLNNHYFILTIDKRKVFDYKTLYFDTPAKDFYLAHHNNKLTRLKIRKRTYVNTNTSFSEIKFKTNKGRTIKKRIESDDRKYLSNVDKEFINQNTLWNSDDLTPSLLNEFNRITLVNKNFKERCTIDLNICFRANNKTFSLDNIVVLEIKIDGRNTLNTPLIKILKLASIKQASFSKYCIGMCITNTNLKYNRFKHQLKTLNKINTYEH
ncbi:polyphosphate polymerase domain-containing protein [Tenacibaculum sp. 190524A02b]|uniref:Polyphosphate polymerase domain-containing protein n=1 Tax=Tenacibaculum vairaonense TaxID=3137860 RepID=A0ABP1FEI5_9FLAO